MKARCIHPRASHVWLTLAPFLSFPSAPPTRYNLDDDDDKWLDAYNQGGQTRLAPEKLETMLHYLEVRRGGEARPLFIESEGLTLHGL